MKPQISSRDLKSLSLFLDGQLSKAGRQRLESRLQGDQALRHALNELRQTRALLRRTPQARAPHNFTLTPEMIGIKERRPVFPVMGFVSALASILFVLVLAGDLLGRGTSSTKQVAMQSMPMLEAAAPTPGIGEEKRAQSEIGNASTPSETQSEDAQALKAIAPAADETGVEPSDTLPLALLGTEQELSVTATPALAGVYAKEAPASGVVSPGETNTPEGTPVMGAIESESQPMASPTNEVAPPQAQVETELTPQALSQNAAPATEMAADKLSDASTEGTGVSQGEAEELGQNVGLREEARSIEGQRLQSILRILEVVLALTALTTAALFLIQRRKKIQ
jgi:hypothetical protein